MHLTGEWFDSLIKTLKPNPGATPGQASPKERRQFPRIGGRFVVDAMLMEKDQIIRAIQLHVRDISPRGIGLTISQKLPIKSLFLIELPLEKGGKRRMLCEVRSCRKLDSRLWGVGAFFLSMNFESDVETAPAAKSSDKTEQDANAMFGTAVFEDGSAAAKDVSDSRVEEVRMRIGR